MTNKERLAEDTRHEEGLEIEAYIDKISKKWHIAYGHLLDQVQTDAELEIMGIEEEPDSWEGFSVTKEQAEALLYQDIEDAIVSLAPTWTEDDLEALDTERYIALISMTYQMGGHKVQNGFPAFTQAVLNEDWDRAADEMMWRDGLKKQKRSAWYRQTPDRCQRMANRMRTGVIETDSTEPDDAPEASVFDMADLSTLSDAELISAQNKIHADIAKRLGVSYR